MKNGLKGSKNCSIRTVPFKEHSNVSRKCAGSFWDYHVFMHYDLRPNTDLRWRKMEISR
jgi:hypothetical protein